MIHIPFSDSDSSYQCLLAMAQVFIFSCPFISSEVPCLKQEENQDVNDALFRSSYALLEARFIIGLLILNLRNKKQVIHYPLSNNMNKQIKKEIKTVIIAGMMVSRVTPSIADALSYLRGEEEGDKLTIQPIINIIIIFLSLSLHAL